MKRITAFHSLMLPYGSKELTDWLITNGFFTSPASTKYHGSYSGGLFDHSLVVTTTLLELTEKNSLEWENPRSPYLVGMFHDLCKIDQYEPLGGHPRFIIRENAEPGHGYKSVKLLSQFYKLTKEEMLCIRYHMGAFSDREEWQQYTDAIHRYSTVLWTHQADMIASHVKGV